MTLLNRLNALLDASTTPLVASAHCDLPCGVYDPAQARIEAQSVKGCMEKFNASTDTEFRERAIFIKEERCELVKHHLWVLWTDYFKPDHLKEYPNLNDLFWMATKSAGEAKKTTDVVVADRLLAEIDDIAVGYLDEFRVGTAVREKRIRLEGCVVDGGAAHLARAIGALAETLERSVHVVQRGFDLGHTLIRELAHVAQSTGH
jgi:nickel superoxide dismutase